MTLIAEEIKRGYQLHLVHHRTGELLALQPAPALPRLMADVPPGPMFNLLYPIVAPRALLPVLTLEARVRTWPLLNEEEKTLARLVAEDNRLAACPSSGRTAMLPPVVGTDAVLGYKKAYKKLRKALRKALPDTEAEAPLLVQAASLFDRSPGTPAKNTDVELATAMTIDAALRAVLLNLHGIVDVNAEGTRAAYDPEFLHDFRVSLRRARVLLARARAVLSRTDVDHLLEEMRWLVKLTGPVRDLDVFILWLDAYCAPAPLDLRRQLAPVLVLLAERRQACQDHLTEAMESPRYPALMEAWSRLVGPSEATRGPDAGRPVLDVASGWIWRAYRRIYRRGKALDAETTDAAFHDLRLACKKLRYLLESFRSLYPQEPCDHLLATLKTLQDVLGEHQDLAVQRSMLDRLDLECQQAPGIPFETTAALKRLTLFLTERQKAVRNSFHDAFAQFSQGENRLLFKQLFKKKNTDPS